MNGGWLEPRDGCSYVCHAPEPVIKLEQRRGKIVATLESGMKFIVPLVVRPDSQSRE